MIPENFCISDKILIIPGKTSSKGIPIDEIIAVVKNPNGTLICCVNEEDSTLCKVPLNKFEAIFAPKGFFRIHNNCLINTLYFRLLNRSEGDIVTMFKGAKYNVARSKCRDFQEAIHQPYRNLMENTTDGAPKPTGYGTRFTVRGFWPNKLCMALYICRILYDAAPIDTCLF